MAKTKDIPMIDLVASTLILDSPRRGHNEYCVLCPQERPEAMTYVASPEELISSEQQEAEAERQEYEERFFRVRSEIVGLMLELRSESLEKGRFLPLTVAREQALKMVDPEDRDFYLESLYG